ncbi:MAG: glycerol kinase [Oscillibacter sp.]|nr:glycerol kinase [Oscillibacter sp.]
MDQGTTSSRCILFDRRGEIRAVVQKEFPQIYPQPGWVEHDPMDIWSTQMGVAMEAMQKADARPDEIAAIGITNQRETTLVWDAVTGKPVCNAIVWQCRRTADRIERLRRDGLEEAVRQKTGGRVHATDYTNASRTMLFDIHKLQWDQELLDYFRIPVSLLPQALPSSYVFGETDKFGGSIPIAAAAGDQQAALFGQCGFEPGDVKSTYGTGGFLLMNTGAEAVASRRGLLTTIAAGTGTQIHYALEGSVFIAGAAIQWLRDEMKLVDSAAQTEEICSRLEDAGGIYVVPAFVGLGAPYWEPYARGTVTGLTRGVTREHFIRAVTESLAYQTNDLLSAMKEESGLALGSLKVDGGASANSFLMQFQADLSDTQIQRPRCIETTALGAAYLAGLASGFWRDLDEIRGNWACERTFSPAVSQQRRQELLKGWKRAVRCAMAWAKDED